jgi:SAM-dependent methyltransferase
MSADSNALARFKLWRESFLDRHSGADEWRNRYFSGTSWCLWRVAAPMMAAHCRGLALDAGAGRSGWRKTILRTAKACEGLDIAPRGGVAPEWIADLTAMPQVPRARFDTVVCHQVLEHVRDPMAAARELARVLRPGGTAIVSVPHLSRRHELPHDYFRFTPEGLGWLLQSAGFCRVRIVPYGGCLSFLHHQFSTLVLSPFAVIPVLGDVLAAIMVPITVAVGLADRLLDPARLAPVGVVAVAEAPADPTAS